MKKLILLAACLFTISTAVTAQETTKPIHTEKTVKEKLTAEQRAQKNVDNLNVIVALDEDQKVKVKDLALARITKADAVRTKYKGQPESKETAKKEIDVFQKEYRQNVKAILTPEQMEKIKAKHKEKKAAKTNEKSTSTSENAIDAKD